MLGRQRGEIIEVQDAATGRVVGRVVVVKIRGDHVRLGLEFDRSYAVHRQEIAERIRREKAATTTKTNG